MTPQINNISYVLLAVLALIAGSILQFYHIQVSNVGIQVSLFLLVCISLLLSKNIKFSKWLFLASTYLLLISLGNRNAINLESIQSQDYFSNINTEESPIYTLEITSNPQEKRNSIGVTAEVSQVNKIGSKGKVQLYLEKSDLAFQLKSGDVIQSRCQFNKIKANSNPHAFDFSTYSRVHGIYHQAYIKEGDWQIVSSKTSNLYSLTSSIRTHFEKKLDNSGIPAEELGVIKALVLGEKVDLDDATRNNYAAAGAMHILAVSGLHVGIVLLILTFLFKPIKRIKHGKIYFSILIVMAIWLYAFITGASSSVLRAAFMFSLISIGLNLERSQSTIHAVVVSAFFLILFNPFIIFDVGFQLSYAAVIGIIFLQPKIASYWLIKNKLLNYFWQIMAVSIAAQIATAPISLYYFHQFPTYFLLTNLIVIPAAFLILFFGIVFLSLSWIPILSDGIMLSLHYTTFALNQFISFVSHLPGAVLDGFYLLRVEVLLLYGFISSIILFWIYRIQRTLLMSTAIFFGFIIIDINHELRLENKSEIVFYNLKEGSAILVGEEKSHILIHENLSTLDFQYNIASHWLHAYDNSLPKTEYNLNKIKSLDFNGVEITFFSSKTKTLDTDYIYFKEDIFITEEIQNKIKRSKSKIVLGNSCSYKFWKFVNSNFSDVHYLKSDDALVLNL
ncbi:MAG: ComEC family competence protein [Crocinitomicaceae bacterium]|nr:ComEC family competence protein [Crocinitomicaceae bacterium]